MNSLGSSNGVSNERLKLRFGLHIRTGRSAFPLFPMKSHEDNGIPGWRRNWFDIAKYCFSQLDILPKGVSP